MFSTENLPLIPGPATRMSQPIRMWSGCLALRLSFEEFQDTVADVAAATGQMFSGFITKEGDMVTSFTRTRYPRKKYGILSIADCKSGMIGLAARLDTHMLPESQSCGFRVVLGLLEGYDAGAPQHSVEEVQQAVPFSCVQPAEIFAVRLGDEGASVYSELAAVIRSQTLQLAPVYDIADRMRQERFTFENFNDGTASLVETRHCTQPDA